MRATFNYLIISIRFIKLDIYKHRLKGRNRINVIMDLPFLLFMLTVFAQRNKRTILYDRPIIVRDSNNGYRF